MFSTPVNSQNLKFAEVTTAGSEHHLLLDKTVSLSAVSESSHPLAATVTKITSEHVWLELVGPPAGQAFSKGAQVRIKCWDEETAYYFDAEIQTVSGPCARQITISSPREEISVQRRKAQRVCYPLSFSFTIIDSANTQLIGQTVSEAETENVSVGGLAFHSPLALKLKDRLEISFRLSPSEQVKAVAWVVRYQPLSQDGTNLNLVALEFLHLGAEAQNKLHLFLAQILPRDASIQWFD
jgi:c-di-GMP-binding flagellar brake protein YcgR